MDLQSFLKKNLNKFKNNFKLTKIEFFSKKWRIKKILEIKDISKARLLPNANFKKLMFSKKVFSVNFMT